MSAFFRRFFAPRWQHRDPAVRRQAVSRLDIGQAQDRERLERLVGDEDPDVRQAALARLDDPARLLALQMTHASPEWRARLVTLLSGREGATPLATRQALLERVDHAASLAEIALHGDNQTLRLAALARIDDEDTLIHQACENGIAAVRHAAAERITSEEGLTRLARQARRDKQVARLARERLNRQREDAAQAQAQRAERERILDALEQHARHAWEPLYAGRYRHLQREWDRLTDLPSADQERRYQDASLRCRKIISDHDAQHQSVFAADRRRSDADETRQALIEALEETLAGLRQSTHLTDQDLASLHAQKRLLASRWQALSDQHAPEAELSQRYAEALAEHDRIGRAWERLQHQADTLNDALSQADDTRLRHALETLDWPDDLPPSPLLERARERLDVPARDDDDTRKAERVAADVEELERLLERGAFKHASRLHQSLRQRLDALPPEPRRRYQPKLKQLAAQLAELRDWRGFVAGPKRDQLSQAIDQLADDLTLSDAELDSRHHRLVKEWRELGDAAANQQLSVRFRAASDRIHERLGPWRQARDQQRQKNLVAREALCTQLEALLDNPDPRADPDSLRQIRDRAREQWRHFSPVPRDQAESVGHRFGRIRHALQTLIDQRALQIASAKRQIIEEARALQTAATPAAQRAEQAKALQRRWRELGRAPKGEEQTLWREFRGLCDGIFAARESERDDRTQRARERLDAMQALIERIDAWQPASSADASILEQAISEAEGLEPLPSARRSDGMRRRWLGIVRARREWLSRLALHEQIQHWQTLRPLLDAHLQADARALDGQPAETIEAGVALDDDLLEAHRQRNAARQDPSEAIDVEKALTRLRVHLALLAGEKVSREDEPLRLAIQVERLNEGLNRAEMSKADELHGVLCAILATGPVPPPLWSREVGELDLSLTQMARLPAS
ncbi:protein of unknown function [Modicisalibacter muralis]|uniref:DUF349 domain-containing protein n=1 Tax=Modicisalibacter muralis TaxID=119000 RepID=A0A1G9QAC7_9GAMM|nr:DUF349 domain-containing protein [Halomonas muralis]SDM07671.1 protein of unknown function [Halomonas muralis]